MDKKEFPLIITFIWGIPAFMQGNKRKLHYYNLYLGCSCSCYFQCLLDLISRPKRRRLCETESLILLASSRWIELKCCAVVSYCIGDHTHNAKVTFFVYSRKIISLLLSQKNKLTLLWLSVFRTLRTCNCFDTCARIYMWPKCVQFPQPFTGELLSESKRMPGFNCTMCFYV